MLEVKRNSETIRNLSECRESKIYAFVSDGNFKTLYKAHKNDSGRWSFVSLNNSSSHANGFHISLQECVADSLDHRRIYEFNTIKEFLTWALDQVKD